MNRDTSDALLSAARAGDRVALDRLLRQHRNGVYRYGLRVCQTTEDAEDAVQETLWTATRAITSFRGSAASVASWMFTIVRRECFRRIERHRQWPSAPSTDELASDDVDPEQRMVRATRTATLASALAVLEPMDREVVLLRDIEERSAPEAASILGISVDALKSRLHRARKKLRNHLGFAS